MERKTFLRLLMLFGGLMLLISLLILLIEPILGVLFIVVEALIFTILWVTWPKLRNTITLEVRRMKEGMKDKIDEATKSDIVEYDVSFHPTFQLVYTRHGRNTKTIIDREVFLIGHSQECNLVISDRTVSGKHCRIVYRKYSQTYYLEDLSSVNGTYLGVRRLEPFTQEKLLEGATITVADRAYRFVRIN